jgi:hypothetical protein
MKNQNIFNFSAVLAVALFVLLGCNAGTANMSSFKTSTFTPMPLFQTIRAK